ncbi:hypothetical protein DL96DRAFT_1626868 [Flagelloscypha sp. PMI_526]|nr:hypothetical protein DL96DRAFT_1626868 [Flagelloscypha sp. PMI_526]
MLEILTGLPPFAEERQDAVTVFHLLNGKRPSRPALELVPEDLWVLINQCWNDAPEQRSLIEDVANQLELLTKMGSQDDMGTDDSEDWVHIDTPRSSSAILRFDSRLFKRVASFYSATQYPLIFRKRAFASNVTSASEEDQIPCYHQDMYPSERNEVLRALSSTSRALRSSVLPALYETVDLLLSATNESTVNLSNQIFSTFSMVTKHEPQLAICIQYVFHMLH